MKIHPQTIYNGSQPEFIVLPIKEYEKLISMFEDYNDLQEVKDFINSNQETYPMKVALALSEGQSPIKVFREHKNLNQTTLANKVNVSKQYISQLESGSREGSTKVLKAIAKVLEVDLEDIT